MKKLLTSVWGTTVVGVVVYIAATMLFWKSPLPASAMAKSAEPVAVLKGPSWDFINPEADQLLAELKEKEKSLAKRERQLDELAARIQSQRVEVNQATQAVFQAQMKFDKTVVRVKEEETANLKRLAKVYSAMSPESTANILAELDNETIIKIMRYLKDNEVAAILENFEKKGGEMSKRAVELSESLRVSVIRPATSK